MVRRTSLPYGRRPHWVLDVAGALWFGDSVEGILHRLSYRRDTIASISLPRRDVALAAQRRGEVAEALLGDFDRATTIALSWIPTARPLTEGLTIDDRNRLRVAIAAEEGGVEYRIFGEDGEPIASASLPPGADPPLRIAVAGDRLHAVVLDALDVPTIISYRLPRCLDARESALRVLSVLRGCHAACA